MYCIYLCFFVYVTKCRGEVINTLSYLRGPGFKTSTLKLGHNHFLLNPLKFIIHLSPFHLML
jgi:hypothetical protein